MRPFISTKLHSLFDYAGGVVITASPWLFGFYQIGGAALFLPLVFGGLLCIMVIFTKHEGGLIKVFPLQLHLLLDMFVGFVLLVSPFLYKFYPFVVLPHVLMGLFLMGSGIFTRHSPFLENFEVLDARGL